MLQDYGRDRGRSRQVKKNKKIPGYVLESNCLDHSHKCAERLHTAGFEPTPPKGLERTPRAREEVVRENDTEVQFFNIHLASSTIVRENLTAALLLAANITKQIVWILKMTWGEGNSSTREC